MTNKEKKAIIAILNKNFTEEWVVTPVYTTNDGKEIKLPQELCEIFNDIVVQAVIPYFADALIAAGIGDVKEAGRKAFVYSAEIAHLDNKLKEAEHRAEVAERALKNLCEQYTGFTCAFCNKRFDDWNKCKHTKDDQNKCINEVFSKYIEEAEKELAEEEENG